MSRLATNTRKPSPAYPGTPYLYPVPLRYTP